MKNREKGITSTESFTTAMLVVFIAPRVVFGLICAALIRDGPSVGKSNPGQDSQIDDDVTNRL